MHRNLLGAALAFAVAGCAWLAGPPCDCGETFERDPFDPDAPSLDLGVQHRTTDHCLCYCGGSGREQRLPPSRTCERYESQTCEAYDDREATWDCP